jgi:hypothetical protein
MKKSKFTEQQIAFALRQVEDDPLRTGRYDLNRDYAEADDGSE